MLLSIIIDQHSTYRSYWTRYSQIGFHRCWQCSCHGLQSISRAGLGPQEKPYTSSRDSKWLLLLHWGAILWNGGGGGWGGARRALSSVQNWGVMLIPNLATCRVDQLMGGLISVPGGGVRLVTVSWLKLQLERDIIQYAWQLLNSLNLSSPGCVAS